MTTWSRVKPPAEGWIQLSADGKVLELVSSDGKVRVAIPQNEPDLLLTLLRRRREEVATAKARGKDDEQS